MATTGFRHTRRRGIQVLALFIGLFVLVVPASGATTSGGSPSPSSSSSTAAALKKVIAVAPTWKTKGCGGIDNLLTVPKVTGVQYLVDGNVVAAGTYDQAEFSDRDTRAVTAQAEAGYVLNGTSSWSFAAHEPECVAPTVTTECGSFTVTNKASYSIEFSWGEAGTFKWDGDKNLAPGGTVTVTTKHARLDFISAPADDGTLFSIEPISVPQNCATPQPTSTASETPKPTASATDSATSTGPVIVTDGGAGEGGNGTLAAGSIGCALGAGLVGFGLRRRLRR